jgi:acylphosphatase
VDKRIHITVSGVVQGVGFRMYARQEARRLGLRGYVRNVASGAVEIVAEGDGGQIDQLVEWARRGPPSAWVESVAVVPSEPTNEYTAFDISH